MSCNSTTGVVFRVYLPYSSPHFQRVGEDSIMAFFNGKDLAVQIQHHAGGTQGASLDPVMVSHLPLIQRSTHE